ncbi:MAG TPA: methyltransferase [Lysobacter sp.]|nr:methyltransferase [Lysobacter sp.]
MYEQTGRYYALFGPHAAVTAEEQRFFAHWAQGRRRALDFGAGLCASAVMLSRLGLEVLAFEPSPVLAALAMDRLNRGDDAARRVTLVEGPPETFAEPFAADLILLRSVLMLLDARERAIALAAVARHAAPGARLVVDVRTHALAWAEQGEATEERALGHTTYRRRTRYTRGPDGSTGVAWTVEAERFGRAQGVAHEHFRVHADTAAGLTGLLAAHGFVVERLYAGYDLDREATDGAAMLVAVARAAFGGGA